MSILEQRITKNKKLFDVHEPQEGHLDRFQDRLKKMHKSESPSSKKSYYKLLRIAASVIVLLGITFALYMYEDSSNIFNAKHSDQELTEVTNYYSSLTEKKLAEIDELSRSQDEGKALKETVLKSVNTIEIETKELEKVYFDTNKDKRVFSAIVSNYRLLASALDKVIENLNDIREKKSGIL